MTVGEVDSEGDVLPEDVLLTKTATAEATRIAVIRSLIISFIPQGLLCTKSRISPTAVAMKYKNRLRIPLKEWKFAGWEGGLAPAQDRMPLSRELTIQGQAVWRWARQSFLKCK